MTVVYMHRRSSTGSGGSPGGGGGDPATDPHWDDVQLLLQFEAGDGSTTITDSSARARSVTVHGNAQIDTAQSKWGGSSLLLDGSGDYLTVDLSGSPAVSLTGAFTIEGWVRRPAGGTQALVTFKPSNVEVYLSASNLRLYFGGVLRISTGILALDTWYHWAYSRDASGVNYLFMDGVAEGGTYTNASTISATSMLVGAYDSSSEFLNGWLDDIRLTVGVCRYTADFTPPAAPFPASGP